MAFEMFLWQRRQTRRFHSRLPDSECRAASRPGATTLCGTERAREVSSHLIGFLVWSSLCGKQSFSPAWETAHGLGAWCYYFAFTMPGGFQVPSPAGGIEGASVFGRWRRLTREIQSVGAGNH